MLTKKLTPKNRIYTKDVMKYLSEFRANSTSGELILYHHKGIDRHLADAAQLSDKNLAIRATSDVVLKLSELNIKVPRSKVLNTDLSRQLIALHWFKGTGYILVTTREVYAGSFTDNPGAEPLIKRIVTGIRALK